MSQMGAIVILLFMMAADSPRRDSKVYRAFRKANPCPVTQKTTGACPGWVVDHVVPLCWGGDGVDIVDNLQWQSQKQSYLKDIFERQACAMRKKYSDVNPNPDSNKPYPMPYPKIE